MEDELKQYEISFLAKEESALPELLKFLKEEGAEITFEGSLRPLELSYPIRKETRAHFGFFHFRALPEKLKPIEEHLRTYAGVLRYLIVTPPFARTSESPMRVRPKREAEEYRAPVSRPPLPLSNEELEKKIDEILQ